MRQQFSTIFLLMMLFTTVSAQYFVIDTLKLNKAYNELLSDTQSIEKQQEYFSAFPHN